MPAAVTNGVHAHDDDIDYSDIEEKYQVHLEEGFDNVIVVDGVPVIDKSKEEKLFAKISKEFARKGCPIRLENLHMPWDSSTGKSKGFLFIEFHSDEEAALAIAHMDGFSFDPKHTFHLNRFTDIEKYDNMDEAFDPPEPEPFKPREHLRAWLTDPQGRDQYVTYRQDDVSVLWQGKPGQLAYEKKNWTDLYVSWSPLGTMMVTMHRQGVQIWGGPSWERFMRFAHPMAKLVDFSPCEQYLVTWSHDEIHVHDGMPQGPLYFSSDDEGNNLAVWDIRTGHLLRTFKTQSGSADGDKRQQLPWPQLKWSPDDKFVARVTPDVQISVYELPSMGLHGKKSIKIEGVVDFEWRPLGDKDREEEGKSKKPGENMIAYWTPEVANQPARVSLMAFPARTVLRAKNLFNVTDCKLHFQNQGDFLCVKVDRHTKTKKSIFCNLEIFRIREKDFPVEVVELKDSVMDFSWEPNGDRFAIISTSDPNYLNPGPGVTLRTDVSFYQLERGKDQFKLLRNLPGRSTNTVRWSPKGRHVVLATVGSSSKSELEFWDLDFNSDDYGRKDVVVSKEDWGSGIQLLGTGDHYGVTDVEWDPSGRFVATSASVWKHMLENGYCVWDFRGQEIEKHIQDRFKQFLWRPRPRTLLSKEQQRQVRKNLREYSRAFEEEDAAEESNVSAELLAQRKRLIDEWNAWRARVKGQKTGQENEEATEEISEWIEEIVEQTEEIVD